MQAPQKYMHSLVRLCCYKIRYGSRLRTGWIQSFERVRIELSRAGRLTMGSCNQNRERLYLGVSSGELIIGSHCFFNTNSSITCMGRIQIGDYCKFGNNLVIVDHDHNYRTDTPEFLAGEITIGNHVWVGANVVILKGAVIGDNCVIAAGSVVKGEVPAGSMLYQKRENRVTLL